MPVDIFGRSDEKASTVDGVSLKYVNTNFQKKEELSTAVKKYVERAIRTCAEGKASTDKSIQAMWQQLQRLTKPLITIWAEERSALNSDRAEWSFGDCRNSDVRMDYAMLTPGKILRMGLSVGGASEDDASVQLVVNGRTYGSYQVYKSHGARSAVEVFDTPFLVSEGDVINFKTLLDSSVRGGIVNLLIELAL